MQVCHFQHLLRPFDKNEPSRFLGEGVFFKAKLIGILEVAEARGDRMCQEALADLKMAIRAAGEHKQRISVHVAIDGLRLRDEKTGDSLYHHPVHKISFIAQDMSDSRAFGYIFGSPDTGHRFFGIKTDKAASQVVIAMRDLFQVVFELKKKEIELAKQQMEGKTIIASRYLSTSVLDSSKNGESSNSGTRSRLGTGTAASSSSTVNINTNGGTAEGSTVAQLVDLEQALNSIERGIHQMDRMSPQTDPFGDSFTLTPTPGFLPPPPSSSRGSRSALTSTSESAPLSNPPSTRTHFNFDTTSTLTTAVTTITTITSTTQASPTTVISPGISQSPRKSIDKDGADKNSIEKLNAAIVENTSSIISDATNQIGFDQVSSTGTFDVFTELDPLGTGRSKPYVDKKHFFQELKNPPKKVLKELANDGGVNEKTFDSKFDESPKSEFVTTLTSVGRYSGGSVSIAKSQPSPQILTSAQIFDNSSLFTADPFAETDPFDNADPFAESLKDDPFITSIGAANNSQQSEFVDTAVSTLNNKVSNNFVKETPLPETRIGCMDQSSKIKFLCAALKSDIVPLQVSLPPEPLSKSPKTSSRQMSSDSKSIVRQRSHSGKHQQAQPSPSPPPPLPPKKPIERITEISVGPPLPLPARRRPTPAVQAVTVTPPLSSLNWLNAPSGLDDDYLAPAPTPPRRPVPSPSAAPSPGLDITLAQLLTCGMDELASRLRMPAELLSRMTLAQLTGHLHDYLQTNNSVDKAASDRPPPLAERPMETFDQRNNFEFEANFEENFTSPHVDNTFEANFDTFNKTESTTYDRYAAFRDIDVDTFKTAPIDSIIQNIEEHDSLSSQPELPCDITVVQSNNDIVSLSKPLEANVVESPVTSTSVAPKDDSTFKISKLEELKNVINNIQKASLSPTPEINIANIDAKPNEASNKKSGADRYAALRDLSINEELSRPLSAELSEEPELSAPLQVPKERKKSDEKSDGFDHSDFFDCIDNSLSLATNAEDVFRKSPMVVKDRIKSPEINLEIARKTPIMTPLVATTPQTMVTASVSDIASGSSPEIVKPEPREIINEKETSRHGKSRRRGDAWALLPREGQASPPGPSEDGASSWSSDSKESPPQQVKSWSRNFSDAVRRHRRNPKSWHTRQTSSSSRDISPWEEDPPLREIGCHSRTYHRDRLESGGSCERRDSVGSRERRDSGSGRDRHRRRHKSRDDDDDWSEERNYSRRLSPCPRSSSKEMRRERAWPGEDHWRPDERGYSTVGRREGSRRRGEPPWQEDDSHRYTCTMGNRSWRRSGSSAEGDRRSGGGSSGAERPRNRMGPSPSTSSHRSSRTSRHRHHRSPFRDDYFHDRSPSPPPTASPTPRSRHQHHFFDDFINQSEADSPIVTKNSSNARFRFSNDFSEKDSPKSQNSPFENDFVDGSKKSFTTPEKHSPRARTLNFNQRFKYDANEVSSENLTASPASLRLPKTTSPNNTSRSLFEDDFSPESSSRNGILRTEANQVIPEGEEVKTHVSSATKEERTEKNVGFNFGPSRDESRRQSQKMAGNSKTRSTKQPELDLKKSESVNIFARDSDPFDGDDFFSCTASDKPKKDNWRGDFAGFDDM